MRISIWQQFSSNNSTSFWVVGEFKTPEQAFQAASKIEHLLVEIAKWYERPENAALSRKLGPPLAPKGTPLSPIEAEYAQKYQIEWGDPINWTSHSGVAAQAVTIFQNLIFVANGYPLRDSGMSSYPMDVLIEKLGGRAWADRKNWTLTITCLVPHDDLEKLLGDIHIIRFENSKLGAKIATLYVELTELSTAYHDPEHQEIVYQFHGLMHYRDLTEFIDYLKQNGCTDIRYEFSPLSEEGD